MWRHFVPVGGHLGSTNRPAAAQPGIQAEQTLSRLNRSYLAALERVVSRLLTQ
jgi:hypothetical protein